MTYVFNSSGNCTSPGAAGTGSKTKPIFVGENDGDLFRKRSSRSQSGIARSNSRTPKSEPALATVPRYTGVQPGCDSSEITMVTLEGICNGGASLADGGDKFCDRSCSTSVFGGSGIGSACTKRVSTVILSDTNNLTRHYFCRLAIH